MAKKNKIGLAIDLEDMIKSLESSGADVKDSVSNVLRASKSVVTTALVRDTKKSNYPAKGKYSTGDLAKSIDKNYSVEWAGNTASINVGYDFDKVGVESVVLLYGTPKMQKAQKLYDDIYGAKTKRAIKVIQQEALNKILERAVRDSGR